MTTKNTNQDILKSDDQRYLAAIDIVTQSLLTPDSELRIEAKRLGVTPELLAVRTIILEELAELRNNILN